MNSTAHRGPRRALSAVIATAAVAALGSIGILPAQAGPSDPVEAGVYVDGQNWILPDDMVNVIKAGGVTCASMTVSFRKASTTTLLELGGRGFPSWGDAYLYTIPAGLTGAGQLVVKCGSTEKVAIPFSILATAPATLYHDSGQWTTLSADALTTTVNKMGYLPGESVRVTLYDESQANEDAFENAVAPPVTVVADGAGAITASIAVPGTFSGDDYVALISSATSHLIYSTSTGDDGPSGDFALTAPPTAAKGSAIAVSGAGFAADESVVVALHGATGAPATLATLTADPSGEFSGSVTIPAGTAAGQYRIWAGSKSVSYVLLNTPVTITNGGLVNTALPAITGTANVGGTLTASKGTWAAVAVPAPTFTYSWWRDGVVIPGATAATYKPVAEDFEATLTVRVQGAKSGYGTTTVESAPTAPIGPGALTPAPVPTITGTAKVGATLTAVPGAWTVPAGDLTYQWSAGGAAIAGATSSTVVLTTAEFGKKITVSVTGTKPGLAATKTSLPTLPVAAIPFVETIAPVVSGTPQVGVPLVADPGTWTPAASFSYQWLAGGVAITGATGATFAPKAAQLGKVITVKVTGSAVGSVAASRPSAAVTATVALGAYSSTPEPTVAGTAAVGSPLTASTTGWDAGSTFTYRWFADLAPITGATAATYTPTATQVGEVITARITTTTPGYPVVVRTSSVGSAAVARGAFGTAPTPTIAKSPATGTLRFGNTLTAVTGTWGPAATYSYQWYADGAEILGAEAATYKPTAAQVGAAFTVRVVGSKSGYTSTARTSAATPALQPLAFVTTPVGTSISGTAKLGLKLTAVVGTFTPAGAYSYQWYAGDNAIDGATASTFTVTAAQPAATVITVKVTGTLPGYDAATKVSTAKTVAP